MTGNHRMTPDELRRTRTLPFVTPIGRLTRAYISVPDPLENFAYSAEVEFAPDEANLLQDMIETLARAFFPTHAERRVPIFRSTGGALRFHFVSEMGRPHVVDAQCNHVPSWVQVRAGSRVSLAANVV